MMSAVHCGSLALWLHNALMVPKTRGMINKFENTGCRSPVKVLVSVCRLDGAGVRIQ